MTCTMVHVMAVAALPVQCPTGDDSIEELPHDVDVAVVLVGVVEAHDVGVGRQVPHNLNLPAHVLDEPQPGIVSSWRWTCRRGAPPWPCWCKGR